MWVCTALQGFQINTGQSLAEFVAVDAHKATITAEMERFGMGVVARGVGVVMGVVSCPRGGSCQTFRPEFHQRVWGSILSVNGLGPDRGDL